MKKLSLVLFMCLLCVLALAGCAHTHAYTPSNPSVATCMTSSIVRYTCSCGDSYDVEISPALGHSSMTKTEAVAATCETDGNPAYYTCSRCEKYYADEAGMIELSASDLVIPAGHRTTHHPSKAPLRYENGNWEYWECTGCERFFLNEACTWECTLAETVLVSAFNHVDFVVDVEAGRDPVVLQLTDPQIYTSDTSTPEEKCYRYIRETVAKTNPDLILVTGDLVYGKYDKDGAFFSGLVDLMESFGIPWAPVFGNHDAESEMGVDWQCTQLEAAEHCLFRRGDVTGNGNYTVGVAQGERLLRVFYMLDTNACGEPSEASRDKVSTHVGFQPDQVEWYTEHRRLLSELDPSVKISIACHIQPSVFGLALSTYSVPGEVVVIDRLSGAAAGDFGIISTEVKTAWDGDRSIWRGIKALGVDSIFVGHEHLNSASIMYEGVRLQYGQKSSTYDRHNWVLEDGTISGGWTAPEGATVLIGGTVIPISREDGAVLTPYIYLVGESTE